MCVRWAWKLAIVLQKNWFNRNRTVNPINLNQKCPLRNRIYCDFIQSTSAQCVLIPCLKEKKNQNGTTEILHIFKLNRAKDFLSKLQFYRLEWLHQAPELHQSNREIELKTTHVLFTSITKWKSRVKARNLSI